MDRATRPGARWLRDGAVRPAATAEPPGAAAPRLNPPPTVPSVTVPVGTRHFERHRTSIAGFFVLRVRPSPCHHLPATKAASQGRGSRRKSASAGVLGLLDPIEPDRHLGVDQRVDRERRALGALCEGLPGPRGPLRVLGHDIEPDVAVDENGQ